MNPALWKSLIRSQNRFFQILSRFELGENEIVNTRSRPERTLHTGRFEWAERLKGPVLATGDRIRWFWRGGWSDRALSGIRRSDSDPMLEA